jgi:predicted kinase
VLVSGPPASGKTFLCDAIMARVAIPVVSKDAIKEALYDHVGTGDVAWSRRLGVATFAVMYRVLEAQLRARAPVLLEGNFPPDETRAELGRLRALYAFSLLELHCTAPKETLAARYVGRAGSRHPGHLDGVRAADIDAVVDARRNGPVALAEVVVVDTARFDAVDVEGLAALVRGHLAAAG